MGARDPVSMLIRRPLEEVADAVMAIEDAPRWRPRMSAVRWVSDDEPGVGSEFEVSVRLLGITTRMRPEVVRWDRDAGVSFVTEQGPSTLLSHIDWTEDDGGCRVTLSGEPSLAGVGRLLGPAIGVMVHRQNRSDLARLKAFLERE